MVTDVANSAVRIWVEFGRDSSHGAWVRTYPCVEGAKVFPGPHAFLFPWMLGDVPHEFVGPGMSDTFEKRSNRFGDAFPGQHYHGRLDWYAFGVPDFAFLLTGDALPPRECEAFVALDVQDIDSSGLIADYPDCSILQFDEDSRVGVEIGHTAIQQVVRWRGAHVGVDGGSVFTGVYNVLFDSSFAVEPVDAKTVRVTAPCQEYVGGWSYS